MSRIGTWTDQNGLVCHTMKMFPNDRVTNLHGKSLKASSFEYKPYIYQVASDDGHGSGDLPGNMIYDGVEVRQVFFVSCAISIAFYLYMLHLFIFIGIVLGKIIQCHSIFPKLQIQHPPSSR